MEACGSAHPGGRWLMARGFDVVLLPAHSVTPYVQRNKTDERDAEGLPRARTDAIAAALRNAERASGSARRDQLNRLAAQLDRDASGARGGARAGRHFGVRERSPVRTYR
jgi:hypothetical protein